VDRPVERLIAEVYQSRRQDLLPPSNEYMMRQISWVRVPRLYAPFALVALARIPLGTSAWLIRV